MTQEPTRLENYRILTLKFHPEKLAAVECFVELEVDYDESDTIAHFFSNGGVIEVPIDLKPYKGYLRINQNATTEVRRLSGNTYLIKAIPAIIPNT